MYFDVAIIVIVALFALIGLAKGFFKTIISFCGWLASFLIAFFVTKPVAEALLDVGTIRGFILGSGESGFSLYSWILGKLPAPENWTGFLEVILRPFVTVAEQSGGDIRQGVALLIANGIFSIAIFFVLLLLLRILLLLFTMFANAMTKDKLVGGLNRLLGLVAGAVKGCGVVAILMVLMSFMMGLSFMSPVREQLDKSVVAKPVYEKVTEWSSKFLSGSKATLQKLLKLRGEEENEPPAVPAYVGDYKYTDSSSGEAKTYMLRLDADGKFTLTGSNTTQGVNGTYTLADTVLTLDPDEEGEENIVCDYNAEGYIWVPGMNAYFAKDGVTPPPPPVQITLQTGTYTCVADDGTYTLVLTSEGKYSLTTPDGNGNITDWSYTDNTNGSITFLDDAANETHGTYTSDSITVFDKTFTLTPAA